MPTPCARLLHGHPVSERLGCAPRSWPLSPGSPAQHRPAAGCPRSTPREGGTDTGSPLQAAGCALPGPVLGAVGTGHDVPPAAGCPEASSGQQRGAGCSQQSWQLRDRHPRPHGLQCLCGQGWPPAPRHSVTQLEQRWGLLWAAGPSLVLGGSPEPRKHHRGLFEDRESERFLSQQGASARSPLTRHRKRLRAS